MFWMIPEQGCLFYLLSLYIILYIFFLRGKSNLGVIKIALRRIGCPGDNEITGMSLMTFFDCHGMCASPHQHSALGSRPGGPGATEAQGAPRVRQRREWPAHLACE